MDGCSGEKSQFHQQKYEEDNAIAPLPMTPIRRTYQFGVAVLLLLVFAVASAITVLDIYAMVAVNAPLVGAAVLVSLLSLYGFYRLMSSFVRANYSDNPTTN